MHGGTSLLMPLIEAAAAPAPDAPAVLAPGREALTYRDVVEQLAATGQRLRALGFGAGERVAIGMPDSPELALTMTAAIGYAAAVPLSPRAAEEEIERNLCHAGARAVIVAAGVDNAARRAARRAGLPTIELVADERGRFRLEGSPVTSSDHRTDAALVVHTSGTTGNPKIVPLTQRNLLSMPTAACSN